MNPKTLPIAPEEYQLLNEFISERFGVHFPEGKQSVLATRLRPRLQALGLSRYMDYYLMLQYRLDSEQQHLTRLVTNNETYFFRETSQFEALLEEAAERLLAEATVSGTLRLLCAGCSSGEEPYTLNIFAKTRPLALGGARLSIDAFDIDARRLATAVEGIYGRSALRATSEEQIHRFFAREGVDQFSLRDRFREDVSFSLGNILEPRSYRTGAPYDVLFCRNVFIYFAERALRRALKSFASVLRPGGLLFLGHAESIIGISDDFETVRLARCIAYQRKAR
ncbi:MAG: CheR family methyltransferase [Thermoanaerobaculia bacterium]